MGNRRGIARVTLVGEVISRTIVSAMVIVSIVVAATSIYPKGFTVMFATAGIAVVVEGALLLRALFYLVKPSAYNLTNLRGGILILVQCVLLALFIIAAVFAFRDYSKEPGYESRNQAAVYDRRIACGVLIMASILFQIVPTIITIARFSQGSDEDMKIKSKESDENAHEH
ncbi:hypothetical protein CCM_00724 [Cordyceps militaris CM01]|uniref:Uncharacterized protein n=1 Tax=Cordyceps militaris (strain CM01) TaxID=983644 RepID=G3J5R2_CORMM|nr:uncharacterized protein CCM_00724 [Cordyceps militaris CM01]EGX96069.1 hypothetical protein CCM_00724 [Cordyceps militaris CM01]